MTTKQKAEKLADWWVTDTYHTNSSSDWRTIYARELMKLPLEELLAVAEILQKYQVRYHGTEHAQKDWQKADEILSALRAKLKKAGVEL